MDKVNRNNSDSSNSEDEDTSEFASDSISISDRDEEMGRSMVPDMDEDADGDYDDNEMSEIDNDDEEAFDDENEKIEFEELYRSGEGAVDSFFSGQLRFPWNAFVLSMVLIGIGGAFLREGILVLLNIHGAGDNISPADQQELEDTYSAWNSFPYILYSIMLLVPGIYHFILIILASCNLYGFSYDMVPFYDGGTEEEATSKYKASTSKSIPPISTTTVTDNRYISNGFKPADGTVDSIAKKTD